MQWLVIGFVAGVCLLQQQASLPTLSLFAPAILLGVLIFGVLRHIGARPFYQAVSLLILSSLFGFFYAATWATVRLNDALPAHWQQRNIEVIGVIATMPNTHEKGMRFQFDVEQVITLDAIVPSHISLNSYYPQAWRQPGKPSLERQGEEHQFEAGQRWRMFVRLKRPHTTINPHGYDFEAWALANNVRAMGSVQKKLGLTQLDPFVWRPAYIVEFCRSSVAKRIESALVHTPYGGVIRALVVGDGSQISAKDWETYLKTGINHLMSISGLHITMLAGLAFSATAFLWRRFPRLVSIIATRRVATLSGVCIACLYACLAGLSVPTQRTLYMLLTFGFALFLNKQMNILRVLQVAMVIVVLLDPWAVVAPGFWLSFSAVGIIAYATLHRLNLQHWLVEAVRTQWAVTLGLLPFLIAMFGQASVISPIANALAIPVISLLVVPLAILGALLPTDIPLLLAQNILELTMIFLNWLADLPYANWYQAFPPTWTLLLGLLSILWCLLPRGWPLRWFGPLLLLPMLLYQPASLKEGQMEVAVLDVGQGLAVVIRTVNHVLVYDTGQRYNQDSDVGNRILLPYLRATGINALNGLVLSHDDIDHNGGADALLRQMPVDWVSSSYALYDRAQAEVSHTLCKAGQQWEWDAVQFEVLYPSANSYQDASLSDNNRSCVIKVSSPHGSVLLTGDIEEAVEAYLVKEKGREIASDVLIAPHHGSQTSSTEVFVRYNGAKHVVFTAGYLNRFKHPRPIVMSRYLLNHAATYRTDEDGAILLDFMQDKKIDVKRWRLKQPKYWHD